MKIENITNPATEKIKSANAYFSFFYSEGGLGYFLFPFLSGIFSVALSSFSDFIKPYGWIGYAACGLIVFVLISAALAFMQSNRLSKAKIIQLERLETEFPDVRPSYGIKLTNLLSFQPTGTQNMTGLKIDVWAWNTGHATYIIDWKMRVRKTDGTWVPGKFANLPKSLRINRSGGDILVTDQFSFERVEKKIDAKPRSFELLFYFNVADPGELSEDECIYEVTLIDTLGNIAVGTQRCGDWLSSESFES